jgi:hypothetical protein
MWAGQGVGTVRRVMPAAEIVREIEGEARAVASRTAGMFGGSHQDIPKPAGDWQDAEVTA